MKAIQTINLYHAYPDGTKAIENVNFSVEKGKIIALLGPNGAGKSTLLHHFNGLLMPTSGKVNIMEKEVTKKSLDEIRQKVGLIFQDPDDQLFARTVAQDIAFGPTNLKLSKQEIEQRVNWALEVTDLKGLENKAPQNLSGGQKRRASIAGVLAMKPEIVILDEPISNLDPKTASKILHLLTQLNKELGLTMIIATHDVDLVPLFADEICILNKGQILMQGPPQEVFSKVDVIRSVDLRLPRITHLFEVLKAEDKLPVSDELPLTIGEARREIVRLMQLK
jgi:cobalt/nickel transport system ATP-binding protein